MQVAILGECAENIVEIAFEYGRNIGIAFQVNVNVFIPLLFSTKLKLPLVQTAVKSYAQNIYM